jgi:hypothetical protein
MQSSMGPGWGYQYPINPNGMSRGFGGGGPGGYPGGGGGVLGPIGPGTGAAAGGTKYPGVITGSDKEQDLDAGRTHHPEMYDINDAWIGAEGTPMGDQTRSAGGYTQGAGGGVTGGYNVGYDSTMDASAGYQPGYDDTMTNAAGYYPGYDDTMGYDIGYDSTMSNAAGYTPGYDNTMTNAAGYYPGYDNSMTNAAGYYPGYDNTMTNAAASYPGYTMTNAAGYYPGYDNTMNASAGITPSLALAQQYDDSMMRTGLLNNPNVMAAMINAAGGMEEGGYGPEVEIDTNVDVGGTRGSRTGGFGRGD